MAEAAAGGGGGQWLPDDLVIWEILTRLPAKPLLRCRAVCRSWRRHLTDAEFLLAHHRRQPSLPLLTEGDSTADGRRFDALDLRTGERRPVARTTTANVADRVVASCDGILILYTYGGRIEICNPATRQRAPLTLLHGATRICALYPHRPSGSYRLLSCFKRARYGHTDTTVYNVHTLGSGEHRCVGEPPGPWACRDMAIAMPIMLPNRPPVLADGRIYWQPVTPILLKGGNGKFNNMLAFDTMAESFQQLLSPVEGPWIELFKMKGDALGLYHWGGSTVDLWVLQDHSNSSWSMNHRIKLDVMNVQVVLDPEGGVQILSLSNIGAYLQHISGANGSLLARYEWSSSLNLSRHRFKESLVHHDFFLTQGDAGGVDEKPLFDGLSTVALVRKDNSGPHKEQRPHKKQRY